MSETSLPHVSSRDHIRSMSNGLVMYNATVRALPFTEQCRATALAGCSALTLTPTDYLKFLSGGMSTREMRAVAADNGIALTHLDPFARWTPKWQPTHHKGFYDLALVAYDIDDFLRMAEALQCRSFTAIGTHYPGSLGVAELTDHFGALCERARGSGLRVDLEFVPFWGINTLELAWQIVQGAGAANSGIMFDIWHHRRSHSSDELLKKIPGSRITGVQLNDGDAEVPDGVSVFEDCLFRRRPPGEGAFRVSEVVAILRAIGGLNNVGPEVFSSDFDQMSAEQIATRCRESLALVMS
jgi:sugar phosphate isomerase/epimerase